MRCPACLAPDSVVSRTIDDAETVIRQRHCSPCGARWVTAEAAMTAARFNAKTPPPLSSGVPSVASDGPRGVGGGLPSGLVLFPSEPSQQSGSGARAIRRGRKDVTEYPAEFLALWALAKAQGKAGNKNPAFKSWLQLNATPELNALISTRFEEWMKTDSWRRGFNQHFVTWLNQRGWEDSPTAADLRGTDDKNARPGATGGVPRPSTGPVGTHRPLRCSTHEKNPKWDNRQPVDWCGCCREQMAKNGTRSSEPASFADVLPAWAQSKGQP